MAVAAVSVSVVVDDSSRGKFKIHQTMSPENLSFITEEISFKSTAGKLFLNCKIHNSRRPCNDYMVTARPSNQVSRKIIHFTSDGGSRLFVCVSSLSFSPWIKSQIPKRQPLEHWYITHEFSNIHVT